MDEFSNLNKYDSFSEFISEALKIRNITRQRLAELLDIHPAKVYRWVSGASLPKKDAVVRIAHFFNLSREDINNLIEKQKKIKYKKRGRKKKKENLNQEISYNKIETERKLLEKQAELEKELSKIIREMIDNAVQLNLLKHNNKNKA